MLFCVSFTQWKRTIRFLSILPINRSEIWELIRRKVRRVYQFSSGDSVFTIVKTARKPLWRNTTASQKKSGMKNIRLFLILKSLKSGILTKPIWKRWIRRNTMPCFPSLRPKRSRTIKVCTVMPLSTRCWLPNPGSATWNITNRTLVLFITRARTWSLFLAKTSLRSVIRQKKSIRMVRSTTPPLFTRWHIPQDMKAVWTA